MAAGRSDRRARLRLRCTKLWCIDAILRAMTKGRPMAPSMAPRTVAAIDGVPPAVPSIEQTGTLTAQTSARPRPSASAKSTRTASPSSAKRLKSPTSRRLTRRSTSYQRYVPRPLLPVQLWRIRRAVRPGLTFETGPHRRPVCLRHPQAHQARAGKGHFHLC